MFCEQTDLNGQLVLARGWLVQTPGIGQSNVFPVQIESFRQIGIPVVLTRTGFPEENPDEQQLDPLAKAYGA